MFNYFLYARKSTDTEDRQVLSIAAQLSELRAFAKRENLHIVETFVEKQSAKVPGRPIFSDMLARIEKGEAQGIICWKLDRLARNPIDGGQISWFLQRGIIQHIQTNDRGYLPADNVLMMSVEFGMANQYILDLSANTKRGQREKVRRGDYPGIAPLGYLNDVRIKKVVVDRKRSKIVRQAFEMYSQGDQRLEDIAAFFAENGITAKSKKPLHLSRVSFILSNPFYCGLFRYSGELHEGKHEQIIPKKLFDKVQEVLQQRTHIHRQPQNDPRPFCGLIRCGTCGMAITAERKTKHQKNGNTHEYVYYRCTRKRKSVKCSEPFIREEELDRQLSQEIEKFALSENWAKRLFAMANGDERKLAQSSASFIEKSRAELENLKIKIQRLLDAYLEQDIERETYRAEKAKLISAKRTLEEKIIEIEKGGNNWLEPLRQWLKDAQNMREIAENSDLSAKKSSAKKIFGSNLSLSAKKISGEPRNEWAALAAAHEKIGLAPENLILVRPTGIEPVVFGFGGQYFIH